jgi:tetratricopeptide (TPR) repeat protein
LPYFFESEQSCDSREEESTIELTLKHQNETNISVICDGQPSHFFDLHLLSLNNDEGITHPPVDPVAYGKAIYQALFPLGTPAQLALEHTLSMISPRLLLVTTDEELDAVPWEYIHGPEGFLIPECHFVRGLPIDQRMTPPELNRGLHIVAVPTNPISAYVESLNIEGEWIRLKEIIDEIPYAITLERTHPPTVERLRRLVSNQRHRVVHFMGHGDQDDTGAILCFEKENGDLDPLTAREFTRRVRGTVFLVTLNACVSATPGATNFSNLAAALVRQQTPYALGMRFNIFDEDARTFSRVFYSELASGSSVEEALHQARLTLARSACSWAIGIPVLYTALSEPASGFFSAEGEPSIKEHRPKLKVSVLPRAEGIFQGRIDELKYLGSDLTGDNRPRIITVHGGGGQGKTALAREAAERFAFAWPGGVWASSLENLPSLSAFVADLALFLDISAQDTLDIETIKHQIFTQLTQRRTLIVLDNAETLIEGIEAKESKAIQLAEFLKQLPSSSVSLLVTSRVQLGWSDEVLHEIGGLLPHEGAALFRQCTPQRANELDMTLARKLSIKLEGHPFSLRLLGAAFNESAISLQSFIDEYEERLMRVENKYVGKEHRHHTLDACIETSVYYLSTHLRSLLSGLWVFHASFSPPMAADIFYPESENPNETLSTMQDSLYTLWRRGLLTRERITFRDGTLEFYHLLPTTRLYVQHQLEQVYAQEVLQERFANICFGLIKMLSQGLDLSGAPIIIAQQAREDFERGATYFSGLQQAYYFLYWSKILHRLGQSQQALKLLEHVKEIAQGQDRSLDLLASNIIAYVLMTIGEDRQAQALFEQTLPFLREIGDQTGEASTLHNMATLYLRARPKQREQALNCFNQALSIRHGTGDKAGEASTLNGLASVCQSMGKQFYQYAFAFFNQALSLLKIVGDKSAEASTLHNLACLLQDMSRFTEAQTKFEESIALNREIANHADEAAALFSMALLLYNHLNLKEDAILRMEQAIEVLLETDLPQDAAGHKIADLQRQLLVMKGEESS